MQADVPAEVRMTDLLGPTVADVFAKMRKHRLDWNAYGQSRDSAADLAARCALELAAEHTARAVAAERERWAHVFDGWRVLQALTPEQRKRIGYADVSDVLDAVARLSRA
jgi:hypothetical protein